MIKSSTVGKKWWRKKRANPEEQLQRSVVRFLESALLPPSWFTAFPAGGGGRVRGARLKAMGLKAGVPDLLVFAPGASVLGIELKSAKGSLSDAQEETAVALMAAGVRCHVARSIEDVEWILRRHGLVLRGRVA